jgi:hypothetical protein
MGFRASLPSISVLKILISLKALKYHRFSINQMLLMRDEHGLDRRTKTQRLTGSSSRGGKHPQAQLVQVGRIGDHIDGNDLAISDRETQEGQKPSTRGQRIDYHDSHRSVHEHQLRELSAFQQTPECAGCGLRSTDLLCCTSGHGCAVGSDHDIRIEHCQQRVKGPFARGGKEGRNHFAASDEIPIRSRWRSPHLAASSTGELSGCWDFPLQHERNLVERDGEEIMEHKGEALGWRKRVQDDQQRKANRVGKLRFFLGVDPTRISGDGLGQGCFQGLLAPHFTRAQHIKANPGDRPRQPCTRVLERASVCSDEVKPGLLYSVLCLGKGAEHPIGYCLQLGTLHLEALNQPVVFIHSFSSFILLSQS